MTPVTLISPASQKAYQDFWHIMAYLILVMVPPAVLVSSYGHTAGLAVLDNAVCLFFLFPPVTIFYIGQSRDSIFKHFYFCLFLFFLNISWSCLCLDTGLCLYHTQEVLLTLRAGSTSGPQGDSWQKRVAPGFPRQRVLGHR